MNEIDLQDPSSEDTDIATISSLVRALIWLIATGLGLGFAWLQLKDLAYGSMVKELSAPTMRRIALAIYYICWVQGATFDLRVQEVAYAPVKTRKYLPKNAIGLVLVFGMLAAVLLWSTKNDRWFAVTLLLFFTMNVVGYIYIYRFIQPFIEQSRTRYQINHQHFSLLRLHFVDNYMCGMWQWLRFSTGMVLTLLICILIFSEPTRIAVAQLTSHVLMVSQAEDLITLIPDISLCVFIAIMELWMWFMRLRVRIQLNTLAIVHDRYSITPQP